MKIKMMGGFSMPVGDQWAKIDITVELEGDEILNPKKNRVKEKADKGIKIIKEILADKLGAERDALEKINRKGQ